MGMPNYAMLEKLTKVFFHVQCGLHNVDVFDSVYDLKHTPII